MIIFGLLLTFFGAALMSGLIVLIGDILMIRENTGISWKKSICCGWLYFIDRFKK